jgi:hypothetical protein
MDANVRFAYVRFEKIRIFSNLTLALWTAADLGP